eukprot:Blabericola_migrator_1__4353@NODE_233_length_11060_cov_144_333303_g198_i0_p3_GENE_NODE_233_length_11060_cov_144_333303_g198_i0NODE_233_length_11060_cov_144_333303_g198_i0_p3_ORF_typecomplete_len447_score80_52Vma12/PF11712_8/3e11Phage_holin_3_6/PF07332_11/0_1_NODE_233_length_11060_cov_144_333303_g198_i0877010110
MTSLGSEGMYSAGDTTVTELHGEHLWSVDDQQFEMESTTQESIEEVVSENPKQLCTSDKSKAKGNTHPHSPSSPAGESREMCKVDSQGSGETAVGKEDSPVTHSIAGVTHSTEETCESGLSKEASAEQTREDVVLEKGLSGVKKACENVSSKRSQLEASHGRGVTVPELWKSMSSQIRAAIAKSHPSANVVKRQTSLVKDDTSHSSILDTAPTEYLIEITDELREITEVKMNKGDITHNKRAVSLDVLLTHVREYNQAHPDTPVNIAPALHRSGIVEKNQVLPEVATDSLKPVEKLRLFSSERMYQKMLANSTPLFQKAHEDGRDVPESLVIEVNSSVAMAVSLLMGLFITFALGWYGGPYIGVHHLASRAVLGLVLAILCMITEVSLIIVRSSKLDRMKAMRDRRRARLVQQALRQRTKSSKASTPQTDSTVAQEISTTPAIKED